MIGLKMDELTGIVRKGVGLVCREYLLLYVWPVTDRTQPVWCGVCLFIYCLDGCLFIFLVWHISILNVDIECWRVS